MDRDEAIQREIETLLRRKIGFNADSAGPRSIERAIKKGMRSSGVQALSDYLALLQNSPDLFDALVESVVIPETSFFRNRASFLFLRQWVAREWSVVKQEAPTRRLRVLSLPCSTGEEPYSIAITLLEEELLMDEFEIDAIDISQAAIDKAKQGIYSPYAFRRQAYRSDDRYFNIGTPEGSSQTKRPVQRYFLIEPVRQKVSFCQGNVLEAQLLADRPPYDVVFCRNLLICFDQAARDRTFAQLNRLLRPNGLLFLGCTETTLVDRQQYRPVPYPDTFAHYKIDRKADRDSSLAGRDSDDIAASHTLCTQVQRQF